MIRITELRKDLIPEARALVARVFPGQTIMERMSFDFFARRSNPIVKSLARLFGISEFLNFWVAQNEQDRIIGTTGLYTYVRDEKEAVWLAWFCVDPGERGKGIGRELIEFSINKARGLGKQFFRLYTSDVPNEADAQILYEKYGFKVTERKKKPFYTLLYRELKL